MVKKTAFFLLDPLARLIFAKQNQNTGMEDIPLFDTMKPDGGRTHIKHDRGVLKFTEFYQKWVDKVE
ncbi:hypothetical protein LC653_36385 [Nostoc sp. CHAB 5784]|uniref:hypothetical protein n=1 Tax=Nostoc mirabile TaxID=2907820 RepID=UPI001E30A0DC|nr:hypothetical protein [Nostoc mirabile]MCC5669180.1 hypothetical protein [Nostoc mirabile CHAB5784]